MSARLRDDQRAALCDALDAVEATAPTLCEGWDAHDLAVHMWVLKHDPLSWPGVAVPALAGGRSDRVKRRWPYRSLVDRMRRGTGSLPCLPLDRWSGHRHALGEYFIHTEDVRRANGLPRRAQPADVEDALWIRGQRAASQLHAAQRLQGRRPETVRLSAPGQTPYTVGPATPTTFVHGLPSEVLLWIYGRRGVAVVDLTPFS